MKRLITFLLLLYGSVGYGQTFDSSRLIKNELYGQKHKRWQVDSQAIIPKTGDTLVKAPGQIKIIGNSFAYTGQDRHWHISSITTGITSESDPVFLASPAFSISNTDITNWNNKNYRLPYNGNAGYYLGGDSVLHLLPVAASSIYHLPYNANAGYYLGGDSALHLLPTEIDPKRLTALSVTGTTTKTITATLADGSTVATNFTDLQGSTPTGYTDAQIDSAIAANKVRFGIEDNTGDQERYMDMRGLGLGASNAAYIYWHSQDSTFASAGYDNNIVGDIVSEMTTSSIGLTKSSSLILRPNSLTFIRGGASNSFNQVFANGDGVIPLSVNGNFADSTGNIDLGTIGGGSSGVTSFNSRSGAVVSQFSDYSTYYQLIGRYIDSLRRVGTTVSGLINGAWIPQFTDSVGTSTPQVNSDWNASSGVAQILNKPTIPTTTSQLTNNSGFITSNQSITVTATGDATGTSTNSPTAPSLPLTLATVNSNIGTFTNATVTVNAKGLVTAVATGSAGTTQTTSYQTQTTTAGQTVVTFTSVPSTRANYAIYRNGVYIDQSFFTPIGNSLTFVSAMSAGDVVTLHEIK